MSLVVRQATAADMAAVRRLCWAYRDILVERSTDIPEIVDHYYAKADYAELLERLEEKHTGPKGAIYAADLNGEVVGCGMTYEVFPGANEIKRVYVSEVARGHGAATAIFDQAMRDSRSAGQDQLVLDTMIHLHEAISLYIKLGFEPIEPFYEPDPRFSDYIRFFGKKL